MNKEDEDIKIKNYRNDAIKFFKWIFVSAIILVSPLVFLVSVEFSLNLATKYMESNGNLLHELRQDAGMILLSCYGGMLGATCAIITAYFAEKEREPPIETVAKMCLGGLVGFVCLLFFDNHFVIKLLYKDIEDSVFANADMTWSSIVLILALAGAVSRQLVTRLQNDIRLNIEGQKKVGS